MATTDKKTENATIKKDISDKNEEITECNTLVTKLTRKKTELKNSCRKWLIQYNKHKNSEPTSQVVIKNKFQGTAADKIQKTYKNEIKDMKNTYTKANELIQAISDQIRKLNTHVTNLENDVKNLTKKLST